MATQQDFSNFYVAPQSYQPINVEAGMGKQGASDTYGRLSRAQWEDYKKRFFPYEMQLFGMYGNANLLNDQVDRSVKAVHSAYGSAVRDTADMQELYNTNLTRRQWDAIQRNQAIEHKAAVSGAKNSARMAKKERDRELLAGGSNLTASQRNLMAER